MPLIGVGLLYRHGYFTQSLSADGWQAERYPSDDPNGLPLELLRDASGAPGAGLWAARRALRSQLVDQTRRRLRASWRQRGASGAELTWIDDVLDEDMLTIGFARRVPSYKRTLMPKSVAPPASCATLARCRWTSPARSATPSGCCPTTRSWRPGAWSPTPRHRPA